MTVELTVEQMVKHIHHAIDDKLGKDTIILNIGKLSSLADYFVITSGSSARQVKAIADSVEDEMTKFDLEPRGKEGTDTQEWVLLDYGDIIVHVFSEDSRDFYNLEKLWRDAPIVDVDTL
ncbi:ribosome silencing factor [Peptacetobacter hominis]|uniref:Ribosomal silencing factor RsfS n=1 Tax=Peptacetobacter hominis TaxID=2743610 RepID=A0A544QY43_9FIRM|nr:ribosome silencing factor [Peptacetobacter hominis]TQQ85652.1 ribosome silencing factor [Peptacetobacter hominis]